jgi:hypothetical protein
MGWVVTATPRPLNPRERPVTYCIGGWVVPSASLEACGKYRPHRDSIRPVRSESLYRLRHPGPPLTSEGKLKDTWRHYPANETIINTERILPGNSLHPRLEAQGWANYCFWISFQVVVIIRCFISVYFRSSFYHVTSNCFAYTTTNCMQYPPSWGRHSYAAAHQIRRPLRSSIDTILPLDYARGHTNQITLSHHTYLTFILILSSHVWDRDT